MGKNKAMKRKREEERNAEEAAKTEVLPPAKRLAEDPLPNKMRWVNKQRVLVLATRGINHRDRHLMEDIKKLMPQHKTESKMERSKSLLVINEMCEMKNCNKVVLFEGRKKRDLYTWFSNVPNGPSVKFLVENIHTMAELKMTGNCLRGARPLLSFDPTFVKRPHYAIFKELLTQIFGVPKHHPKSQPFFDHVFTFTVLDNRIWFRNYQILSEDGALAEIGPRFVLNPVKLFSGSFGGPALWDNMNYLSPAKYRQQINKQANFKYTNRIEQKVNAEMTKPISSYKIKPLDDIFAGDSLEKAKDIANETTEKENAPKIVKKINKKLELPAGRIRLNAEKTQSKKKTLKKKYTGKKKGGTKSKKLKKNSNKKKFVSK